MVRKILITAPAKINLFLEVAGKRPDGYHNLATVFAKISLSDELTLKKTTKPGIRLSVVNRANLALSKPANNIVYKAAAAFFEAFKIGASVEIKLIKKVPVGAGLGGGSSDAAAALKGLCALYGVDYKRNLRQLNAIALALGSDVPFFMTDCAFAGGAGRGERLAGVKVKSRMPFIVLVYPGEPVYTGTVYKALKPASRSEKAANMKIYRLLIKALETGQPLKEWSSLLFNRLEEPVLPRHPAVRLAKERLIEAGAGAVLMSGSGASVFALVETGGGASKIAKLLRNPGYKVFTANFC
jgi:4-diphosphocytidyl-2-C-methyl-D-erythritol kinase